MSSQRQPIPALQSENDAASPVEMITRREILAAVGENAPPPLQVLLGHARPVYHTPQDVLYHQGSECHTVYFITGGLLKLVTHLANGRARIVRLHRHGSVLGLSGLRCPLYEHTAVAVTPVTALRLPLSAVNHLRSEEPSAYVTLIECWHDHLRDADTWITQFSTGPIRGRVARLLAYLSYIAPDPDATQVQLLTCEEMGCILGVTAESVSRIIAEFKRQHILDHRVGQPNETYTADSARLHLIAQE
ncbi:MAG: Crp/Fnr family transcriptional regulator [Gammaproteobacteria bacterium]